MGSYSAVLTLARRHSGAEFADQGHGTDLDAWHAVTGVDHRQRAQIIITIEAEDLAQATATARAVLAGFTDQGRLEVMTTAEYDRADAPIPQLLSVLQVAAAQGTTRQAVLKRIAAGSLPACKVGNNWVIPAAAAARDHTDGAV